MGAFFVPTYGEHKLSLKIYEDLEQGSDEWLAARCGIVTASVVGQLITPKTIKPAANDTARSLTATLVAERITGFVEPMQTSQAMERGTLDEPFAREIYSEHFAEAVEVGFMTQEFEGVKVGFSPDGLVGDDGLIEIKSRNQRIQLATILADEVPLGNVAQIQCGLLVSGRDWCDYVSFSGGMSLYVKRVYPDIRWFTAIKDAVKQFEADAAEMVEKYALHTMDMPKTERIDHFAEVRF